MTHTRSVPPPGPALASPGDLARVVRVARQGRWWRGTLAVTLLLAGVVMWFQTDDTPAPWLKRKPPLASAVQAETQDNETSPNGPELTLALATTPATPAVVSAPLPKPLRVTDFFAEPPPEPLATAHRRLKAGTRMSANDVKALMAYDDEHPGDPRVQLLFAYDSMELDWKRAAIGHYLQAYRTEPQAREDVRMLPDLIRLASDEQEGAGACDALEEIFGVDALPGVEDAIADAEHENRPEVVQRLSTLRDRLRP